MSGAIAHPREAFSWLGSTAHELAFLDSWERGRLHHAWLVVGLDGVGKATFAYRAARRLLGAKSDSSLGPLGAAPDDPVCRQILGRAHPDLLVLQRDPEDGKTRRNIPVDEARGLAEFFSKSPAASPYRVAIIDAADDLNASAANALLKTMEEPPERGVIFLICRSPGALLATVRSRCRRLGVQAAEGKLAVPWVADRASVSLEDAARLLSMARGAAGAAWRMGAPAIEADEAVAQVLTTLPSTDGVAELALADSFRGPLGAARFHMFLDRLSERVKARALATAGAGDSLARAEAWASAWLAMVELQDRAEAVNLDRAEVFSVTLSRLRAIA